MKSRLVSALERLEHRSLREYRRDLWLIVLGGMLYKLLFLWLYAGLLRMYDAAPKLGILWGDSIEYYSLALTLLRSFAYHSELRTPGYPSFLSLIYACTRDPNPESALNLNAVYIVQSAMITLGCLPLADAVRRLTGRRSLALIAAFVWAFHNSARYYAHWVLTEALTATLICCLAYAIVRAVKDEEAEGKVSLVWFAVTGAVMFAVTLVRPSCSLLAIPVGAGLFYTDFFLYRRRRQGVALALLLLAFPLSSQDLWAWRNYAVEGKWYYCRLSLIGVYTYCVAIPIAVSQGMPPSDSWGIHSPAFARVSSEFWALSAHMSPQAVDRYYRARMWSEIRQYPGVVIAHYLGSIPYLFVPALTPRFGPDQVNELQALRTTAFWRSLPWERRLVYGFALMNSLGELVTTCALLALCAVGLVSLRRWPDRAQRGVFLTVGLIFPYWVLVHATTARYAGFVGASRFLMPLVPLLILAGADAATRLTAMQSLGRPVEYPSPPGPSPDEGREEPHAETYRDSSPPSPLAGETGE